MIFSKTEELFQEIYREVVGSYLVLHSSLEERKSLLRQITREVMKQGNTTTIYCDGKSWSEVYHLLSEPSLLEEKQILVWDHPGTLSEREQQTIHQYICRPSPWAYLLIGSDSPSSFSHLHSVKLLYGLNLSKEKGWEKEKRQKHLLLTMAKEWNKSVSSEALSFLLSLHSDTSVLESEMLKVMTYVGAKSHITETDCTDITSRFLWGGWREAEEFLWEGKEWIEGQDRSVLVSLLAQMRFLLHQARLVCLCREEGKSVEDTAAACGIKPFMLQKIEQKLRSYPVIYFSVALECIYKVELLAKDTGINPDTLLHYLRMKLADLKRQYA